MAKITPAAIAALEVNLSNLLQGAWGDTPTFWQQLAMRTTSTGRSSVYGAMGRLPSMREWIGPRLFQNIVEHAQTIVNRDFELSVSVSKNDLADDQLGAASIVMREIGRQAAKWPDDLVRDQLQANPVGFDGLSYFNDAHTLDPAATQDNDLALALSATNYETARTTMMTFNGADGEPLGIMPDLLVVPPQLEGLGKTILQASRTVGIEGGATGGNDNIHKGSAKLLVVPRLANVPATWYLFDTSRAMKPWIWQVRQEIEMAARTNVNDENVFLLNEFQWGIHGRGNVGPGAWFLGLRSVG